MSVFVIRITRFWGPKIPKSWGSEEKVTLIHLAHHVLMSQSQVFNNDEIGSLSLDHQVCFPNFAIRICLNIDIRLLNGP